MATLTANRVSRAATRSVPEWTASATNASDPVTRPVTSLTVTSTTAAATLRSAACRRARASRRAPEPLGTAAAPPAPPAPSPSATVTGRRSRTPRGRGRRGQTVPRSTRSSPAPPGPPRGPPRGASSPQESGKQPTRPSLLLLLREQPAAQLPRGPAAVADRVLLLRGELRHREVAGMVVGDERGVVAEAAFAARLVRQTAFAAAVHHLLAPTRLDARDRAYVLHARVAIGRHLAQQLGQVLLVGGVLAREAGRPHARRAAQSGRLDAGVVRDRGAPRGRRGRARLGECVVREGGPGLRGERDLVRQPVELDRSHQLPELAQLVIVPGCEDEPHLPRRPSARRRAHRFLLRGAEALDARGGERQQLVQRRAGERGAFGGGLHLDQTAVAGHDHVGVDLGGRVLRVVEVEQGAPVDDPAGDGGHRPAERYAVELPLSDEAAKGQLQRDVAAGDGGAACAAVCLEDVAIDPHRPLAQSREVDHAAQRAADEALDLDRAPVGAALRDVAPLPLAGRGGKHPLLRPGPTTAPTGHPARNLLVHAGRADHARAPRVDEARAVGRANEAGQDVDLAELAGGAPVMTEVAHAPLPAGRGRLTRPASRSAS